MDRDNGTKHQTHEQKFIREEIVMALGEASMCWRPIPEGVFLSEEAIGVADRLLATLREIVERRCSIMGIGCRLHMPDREVARDLLLGP